MERRDSSRERRSGSGGTTRQSKQSKPLPPRPDPKPEKTALAPPRVPPPRKPGLDNLVVYQNAYNITLRDPPPPNTHANKARAPSPPAEEPEFYQNNG